MVHVILQRALANQEKELRWFRKEENKWPIIFKSLTSKVIEILLQKTIIWKDEGGKNDTHSQENKELGASICTAGGNGNWYSLSRG